MALSHVKPSRRVLLDSWSKGVVSKSYPACFTAVRIDSTSQISPTSLLTSIGVTTRARFAGRSGASAAAGCSAPSSADGGGGDASVIAKTLKTEDVDGFDVVLGPRSHHDLTGAVLVDCLQNMGYARIQMFVSRDELVGMNAVARQGVEERLFLRLPIELEAGYLGKAGEGKTLKFDPQSSASPDWMKNSTLQVVEDAMSSVGDSLRDLVNSHFGFDIHGRTNTLLVLPFDGDTDALESRECENKDYTEFHALMRQAKLLAIMNAGPEGATLKLMPKAEFANGDLESSVAVAPGTLAIFSLERFKFSYKPQGQALSLMSWFLDQPSSFGLYGADGDFSVLGGANTGPAMPQGEHVSVVSLGTRYAFGMDDPAKLWAGYSKACIDTFTEFPLLRWDLNEYYEPDADASSGKCYCKHGGFCDGIEYFDSRFFDISPAEARGMDPAQRQVLEVGYIALSGGGYDKKSLQKKSEQVGVFVGIDKNEWLMMPKDFAGGFGASNTANSITSNRFNYSMNLKGPSMTIDTACSASLVSCHTAKLYLSNKMWDPCSACVAIGVNLLLTPTVYIACCAAGMLSHKGRCFTYDKSADGYARGESTASVCLKLKQWDSEAGDMCVLAGSNVNQDGRSASLTAPNGPSQERCSQSVLREVGITPAEVDTTECHGTGTPLGDPIEIGAYRKAMSAVERTEPVIVTTSKSLIGHCEGSAGISGFIKCVLMCMHAEGTPNCHLTALNPHLDIEGFPAALLTEGVVMRANASYNGVLSFGFGGTNACAQCWGQNIATSRGQCHGNVYQKAIQKIQNYDNFVNVTGEDWEDWEVAGYDRNAKPGDQWQLEIDEHGKVDYIKLEKETLDLGDSYYLTGTFNNWELDALEEDAHLTGLFAATVTIGRTGEERFQIVADRDASMTFYPKAVNCQIKSTPIEGPSSVDSRDSAWCLQGSRGDRFRVEFYKSESGSLSISWVRA